MNTYSGTTQERPSKGAKKQATWPKRVGTFGRKTVTIFRRKTPSGNWAYMVVHYADGNRRKFESFPTEAEAMTRANSIVNNLNEGHNKAAMLTEDQAMEFINSETRLKPFGVSVDAATAKIAECLKVVAGLAQVGEACQFFAARHRQIELRQVSKVVEDLLKIKEARGASDRYLGDLRYRLNRFADDFKVDIDKVTTSQVQEWLDRQKLKPQGYKNFRQVLSLLFRFAVARGFASDNPVDGLEKVKVRGSETSIYTPDEISRLLAAASKEFKPCIAIGAFAGLRSAEIERLEWRDVDLVARHIVVGASRAKTASRRIVPIHDNLASWLADYADKKGMVWPGAHDAFYDAQQETSERTLVKGDKRKRIAPQEPVEWRTNALRHSYVSYRFAQIGDAGRVAGECGNSAAVVHKHYRELVTLDDAKRWFDVRPEAPDNVIALKGAV